MKMHSLFDEALLRILLLDPLALLLLSSNAAAPVYQSVFEKRLRTLLVMNGVSLGRVLFIPQMEEDKYR